MMGQIRMPRNLYPIPCTPAYWREANLAMRSLKLMIFAALMIAATRALSLIPAIPIWHTEFTWGFLARALRRIYWGFSFSPPVCFSRGIPCLLWRVFLCTPYSFSAGELRW